MWNLISDLKALQENSLKFLSSRMWLFDALRRTQKIIPKRLLNKGIKKPRLKLNLGLALISLPTTGPLCLAVCMILLVVLKLKPLLIHIYHTNKTNPTQMFWLFQDAKYYLLVNAGYPATSWSMITLNSDAGAKGSLCILSA